MMMAAKKLGLPTVIDSHLCYFNLKPYRFYKRAYYRLFNKLLLPRYDNEIRQFLPLTPESEVLLERELGISRTKMTQATLGTDTRVFHFQPDLRQSTRGELGIADDVRAVIVAGRLIPPKDLETVVDSLKPSLAAGSLQLIMAGPITADYEREILNRAGEAARRNITMTGFASRDQLNAYFCASDIGIWAGDGSISIIDAMACGLPLVISRSPSTSHLIARGNGVEFTRGDSTDLANQIERLLTSDVLLKELHDHALSYVSDVFSWESVASRSIKIYEHVLGKTELPPDPIW